MLSRNEHNKAMEIAKKMSNPEESFFLIEHTPKEKEFKREILKNSDLETKKSIISSPVSKNAKGTIIVFSGLGGRAMMPFEILDRYFAALNLNAIYLLDFHRTLYLGGISGYGDSLDTAVEYLKTLLAKQPTENIYTFGTSLGGMAAIIYANKLNAKASICFSPLSNIAHPSETRGKSISKRMKKDFAEEKLNINYYLKNNSSDVSIEIFYGEGQELDKMQAKAYDDIDNININEVKDCNAHASIGCLQKRESFLNLLSQKLYLDEV